VWMEAFHQAGGWFVGINADENGKFTIPVIEGTWQVFPYDPPHVASQQNVVVNSGQTVNNINFVLHPSGSISGIVVDKSDKPIQGAQICANDYDTDSNGNCTQSDANGNYDIDSLSAGDYRVDIRADGWAREYYNDIRNWSSATRVPVTAGTTTSNINFVLEPGGSISGHVYQTDGVTPIPNMAVSLDGPGFGDGTCTDQNGAYTLNNVAYGVDWRVRAAPAGDNWCGGSTGYASEYWHETTSWDSATTLTLSVGMPSYNNINFTLGLGGSISGYVHRANGTTPIDNARVYAMDTNFQYISDGYSGSDGSYMINGLVSGTYYLAVEASGFGGVYYNNSYDDSNATLVTVTASANTPNINFQLSPEAQVSGHVYKSDGETPLAGAKVEIWPKNGGQIRSTTTNADGSYVIGGLSTGIYVARSQMDSYAREYYNNHYGWRGTATPISVAQPRTTSGIDFTLELSGNISGYVYQDDGSTPIANMAVSLLTGTGEEAGWVCSDASGHFIFASVSRGVNWKVSAVPSWRCPNEPEGYIHEYWQNTRSWDDAATIILSPSLPNYGGVLFTLDQGETTSGAVGTSGGSVETQEVSLDIPSGAISNDITFTVTDDGGNYQVTTNKGDINAVVSTTIGPEGTKFDVPATLTFHWPDENSDGLVDGTSINEGDLCLTKDGVMIAGLCSIDPLHCNMVTNIFTVQVSSLSEFIVGYPNISDATFSSTTAKDGWVLETSETSNHGGTKNVIGFLSVGDDARNKQYRSILHFDTSSLPDNAIIFEVTLKIKQAGITGVNPFTTHGSLLADMAKGFFGKSTLENTDFQAQGIPVPNIGSFVTIGEEPGWYQLALSPANAKYVNLAGVTQFRLRFARDDDNDRKADFISFYGGEDATNPPQLIVEYTTP
jgi:hypothetical protein